MPAKTGKGGLAGKLGSAGEKALQEHKNDDTTFSGAGELPAGIENGIAQLVECKFGQYGKGENQGEYFFYAAGVVILPKTHEGLPIEGLRTQIGPEPICDTPKSTGKKQTMADHLAWTLNELRKLGATTAELDDLDNLEGLASAMKEAAPYFRFRTWKGEATKQYPNPRTNHDWGGWVEFTPADDGGVVDESQAAPAPSKAATKPTTKPAPAAGKSPPKTPPKAPPASEPSEDDLTALGAAADVGDSNAQNALLDRGEKAGIERSAMEEADSWATVATMVAEAEGGGESQESAEDAVSSDDLPSLGSLADGGDQAAIDRLAELADAAGIDHGAIETWTEVASLLAEGGSGEEEEFVPVKNDVHLYKPPKAKKAIECEVTAVFEGKKTCNLKNLDDGKTIYKGVPWDSLQRE